MRGSNDLSLLRRIAAGIDTAADRAALADRVRAYLTAAPAGLSLDSAFGLTPTPGQLTWWRAEALATRDAVLRALADRFHADLPTSQQAIAIHASLRAYAASAWRFDRTRERPPVGYIGTPREMQFDALRASDVVLSAERIRRVLRDR